MAQQLTEQELRAQAIKVLADKLGPIEALRFLALVSREPFDYQRWRQDYFSHLTIDELLADVQKQQTEKPS